jgi:hypothetical protein
MNSTTVEFFRNRFDSLEKNNILVINQNGDLRFEIDNDELDTLQKCIDVFDTRCNKDSVLVNCWKTLENLGIDMTIDTLKELLFIVERAPSKIVYSDNFDTEYLIEKLNSELPLDFKEIYEKEMKLSTEKKFNTSVVYILATTIVNSIAQILFNTHTDSDGNSYNGIEFKSF